MKTELKLHSYDHIYKGREKSKVKYWFYGIIIFMLIFLFLPWTQNIRAKGNVTTLFQEQRPQEINTPISGKIQKWYVKEGDLVRKGDTIVEISEIKENYLDPQLIGRTQEQVDAKKATITYYKGKIGSASSQIVALNQARDLKIENLSNKQAQLEQKLSSVRAELSAAENEYKVVKDQYERQQKMFEDGLVSQTQLQQRNMSFQNALSKKVIVENKLAQTLQEFTNIRIEQSSIGQEYAEKISKAEGDRFQSYGEISTGQGEVSKLENQVSNYTIRNGMYIITAPQDGQIVQAKKSGIGELLKDGELITLIVPTKVDYAVEMDVRPIDLPLIEIGQKVRFAFDGFPAIVFRGWPEGSYGTFGGKVVMVENTIGSSGMFRILVAEDSSDRKWPSQLKIGSGAQGIALIKEVPIWYELWRNINGFPPDYYKITPEKSTQKSAKK